MLKVIEGLPAGVIGFEAQGEIHAEDYRDTLVPAVQREIEADRKVRIVLVFPSFGGVSGGGAWEDLKMGVSHLTKWERIALVTDVDWMITLTTLFGWMSPGDLKRFPMAERDKAIAWAAEGAAG